MADGKTWSPTNIDMSHVHACQNDGHMISCKPTTVVRVLHCHSCKNITQNSVQSKVPVDQLSIFTTLSGKNEIYATQSYYQVSHKKTD